MRTKSKFALTIFMLWQAAIASAEDIDVYGGIKSDGDRPNLVVLLDNAGAWNGDTTFSCPGFAVPANNQGKVVGFEQCGLYTAATAIGNAGSLLGNINMGLMLFSTGSTNGGTFKLPAASPYTLPVMDSAGITAFKSVVASIDRQVDASNNSAVGAGMQEIWAYYKGATGLSGTNYSGSTAVGVCKRNFALYIANATNNGKPQDAGQTAIDALRAAGANSAQMTQIDIPDPYDKYEDNYGDEWARFMYQTDLSSDDEGSQNIITYTIILTDGSNPEYVEFLKSMASFGGGKYFLVTLGDMDALVQAMLQVFNEVQGVNSAFSSSSLPVSANTQGTYLNQVFMGVFRPDESALPRWQGNLKQYKFGLVDDTLRLVDANGDIAVSSAGTGFISPNAVSFWTKKDTSSLPDSTGGFWRQRPQGASAGYDSADGEVVEKGGVHQQIRLAHLSDSYAITPGADSRKLYTCTGSCAAGSALSSTLFASSNTDITAALLGTTSPTINVSSISRNDSTNVATVTLAATPDPALTNGQLVTISGSQYAAFNGIFSITVVNGTQFTFPLPQEGLTPITPASGTFTVSEPGGVVTVSSLTRSGTTVTATTAVSHGFAIGSTQTVSITGAGQGEYNATNVTATITGGSTFTYPLNGAENPTSPGGGGTAAVGGSSFSIPAGGIVRTGTNVTVTNTATGNTPPKGWSVGNSVTISGATPSGYDGTWTVTNVGNACAGGTNNKSFCFTIPVTPVSPATGSVTADFGPVVAIPVSSITRGLSNCPASALATVSVTTDGDHGFADGAVVSVAGVGLDASESAYATSATITTTGLDSFTYQLAVSPACSDTTSGMKAKPTGGDKDSLISWIRGKDNAADEPSPDTTYTNINIRPSVHGDVLHSRPVAVNYGGSTGVVVFYGSNDGVFRAVNGNQVNPSGSSLPAPGSELWGFIAPEFFSRFSRLKDNSPQIKLESTPTGITPSPQAKDYFFDGATGVYQDPVSGKVYLYLSARRGGRLIYALDVSNPTAPKFMWKRSNTDTGFSELGQSWSLPKVARIKGYDDPVVIFAAGYDPNEDAEPPLANSMGRGIFILDALDGDLVWRAGYAAAGDADQCSGNPCGLSGMNYAMPSDITVLDRDRDGYVDRLYAPDLGGNIWRVDFETLEGDDPTDWQVTRFAALGGTGATKRKIFYPPDVVPTNDFDAVLVGTGDREHPVSTQAAVDIRNRFYMIKDTQIGKDAGNWTAVKDDSSATAFAATDDLFDSTTALYNGTLRGFYLNLLGLDDSGQSQPGEKVVNAPTTVGGITYFGTNQPLTPDANTCQPNLGVARGYGVDFYTGESYSVVYDGGGLPPSPVVGVVLLENDEPRQFCIGCAQNSDSDEDSCARSSIEGCETKTLVNPTRTRSYWYEK
jgi:type IV pilus assembly protein PilY1